MVNTSLCGPINLYIRRKLFVNLWAVVGQVKNKVGVDKDAEPAIRPICVPRDRNQPLPYQAILMELGNESRYGDNGSRIKYATSESPADGVFGSLW